MQSTIDKALLYKVIDALPHHELDVIYRMFSSFIEEYLDTHLTEEEYKEHIQALESVREGEYVLLSSLPN